MISRRYPVAPSLVGAPRGRVWPTRTTRSQALYVAPTVVLPRTPEWHPYCARKKLSALSSRNQPHRQHNRPTPIWNRSGAHGGDPADLDTESTLAALDLTPSTPKDRDSRSQILPHAGNKSIAPSRLALHESFLSTMKCQQVSTCLTFSVSNQFNSSHIQQYVPEPTRPEATGLATAPMQAARTKRL